MSQFDNNSNTEPYCILNTEFLAKIKEFGVKAMKNEREKKKAEAEEKEKAKVEAVKAKKRAKTEVTKEIKKIEVKVIA